MSTTRTALVLAAGLGLAAASQATAAPSIYKITGGGQVIVVDGDAPMPKGAYDTLTYTAQGDGDTAKGQVQFVGRGASQDAGKFHGIVTNLLAVTPNEAGDGGSGEICGYERDSKAPFTIFVQDNGEGAASAGDTATLTRNSDGCDGEFDGAGDDGEPGTEDDTAPMAAVARGNAQVHKVKGGESGTTQGGAKGGKNA